MKIYKLLTEFIYFLLDRDFFVKFFNNFNLFLFRIKKKPNIYFVVNEEQKWSTDQLYFKLKKTFNVKLIILRNPNDNKFNKKTYDFFIKKGEVVIYQNLNFLKKLKLLIKVDIIFFQQPWGCEKYIKYMRFFGLSIYIPYSAITIEDKLDYSVDGFHEYLWLYVAQNEIISFYFNNFQSRKNIKCIVLGYPKFDDLYKGAENGNENVYFYKFGLKKIIYAPHHSLKESILGLGTFDKYYDIMLDIVNRRVSSFVYKPHPRLEYVVTSEEKIFSFKEYNVYLSHWNNQINTKIMDSGDYGLLFQQSDFIITDCSSFLVEYFFTKKPIIWLKSARQKIKFNNFVEELIESFYIVNSPQDLIRCIEMLENGEDPLVNKREELLVKYEGSILGSSDRILKFICGLKDR